jgi:hypothetical protein
MSNGPQQKIGFIGVGMMGHGICLNLIKAGLPLTVIAHRNRARIDDLLGRGAAEAKSLRELATGVDVVMICVNSADSVAELVREMLPAMSAGKMIIDVTTSKPETSEMLAAEAKAKGVTFIDAPVVGGPPQAAEGKLGTFVGGSEADLERAMPILQAYSADVAHFGPIGAGNKAKLLNNFLTIGLRQLVTQTFRAARRNGIDEALLYRLASKGAAGSRVLDQFVQGALAGDYTRNKFSIANCHKDVTYAAPLFADDPDGKAIQEVMQAAYGRLVAAGLGVRMSSEMLDPEVEAQVKRGA